MTLILFSRPIHRASWHRWLDYTLLFMFLLFYTEVTHAITANNSLSITQLGSVQFQISDNSDAQKNFEKGLLLLHSFEYDDARKYFQCASSADPNNVMPYWGIAMTYNHPIWNEQDYASGALVVKKIDRDKTLLADKRLPPAWKGLIAAIHNLYGKGNKVQRDLAYAKAMQLLHQSYPDNDEIACFYALSLLGTTEKVRDFATYMRAAAILEEVFARQPNHPGALHYLIHSYDDPIHAPLGLRPARIYAKVAPAASHALHMPSHIFLALGMWDEVIHSNLDAWHAGDRKREICDQSHQCQTQRFLHGLGDDLHALAWLTYGYLQKKDFKNAYDAVNIAKHYVIKSPNYMTKWYYSLMRAAYLSESKDWHADLPAFDIHDMALTLRANDFYVNGMIAMNANRPTKILSLIKKFKASLPKVADLRNTAKRYYTAITPTGLRVAHIAIDELQAQWQLKNKQVHAAIQTLKRAAKSEDQMPLSYGPPFPIKPPHELLGDILIQQKLYARAAREYELALKRSPGRTLSMEGLQRAVMN